MSNRKPQRWMKWLWIPLLALVILGGCGPLTPSPTPVATPTSGPPTATPPPTVTPLPTLTPLPLPPPTLLSRSPAPGEQQPLDAPIVLTFDQPMERASVEAAFEISPAVEGDFSWTDDRTVSFAPVQAAGAEPPLERGQSYQVRVAAAARNIEGTALAEGITFEFGTVGYLTVSQVLPAPDSDELDPNMVVTVVFDRPVVPLTAINRQTELPKPLTFVPPVRGQGEWLNTSIYVFRPETSFLPATRYKARVAAGLTDTTGGVLDQDYTWEFITIRPAVLDFQPADRFQYVGPSDVISVTFNQPMNHESVQDAFSLKTGDVPVTGSFRWSGGETDASPETMVFVPAQPLPRSNNYRAQVAPGARAKRGDAGIEKATDWRFTTIDEPGIISISPENGAQGIATDRAVTIEFASPMQREGFLDHLTIRPQVTNVYTYWYEYDTQVSIHFPKEPVSSYSIALDAQTPDKYGALLGRSARVRFTTGDLAPYATLNTEGRLGVFSAYTGTVLYASHRNVSRLDVELFRLSPQTFLRLNSNWEAWDRFKPDEKDLVNRWLVQGETARNESHLLRLNLADADGVDLPPGLYYLEMRAPEIKARVTEYEPARYMFVKSRLNLALKQGQNEVLVWATDLDSGQPVSGLPVSFYDGTQRLSAGGETGVDGVFLSDDLTLDDLWEDFFAITGEPGEANFGVAYNRWEQGISPWDFGIQSEFWGTGYQGYVYTDRPIYRPGQTVYYKGILRADDDARYSLPHEIKTVEVRINDPQGKELYLETVPLSDMGTLYDELVLSQEAPLGTYYIELQDAEHDLYIGTSFSVAEYKRPDFQVSVSSDHDAYLSGETINVSADGTYYFGGAVAQADVHWSILSSPYTFRYECPAGQDCPWYSWDDHEWSSFEDEFQYGGFGRLVAEGDAETGDQGRVTFDVPADITESTQSQVFTLEASLTDINGQQVSNRTAVIVHKGQFYIGVAPRGYLAEVGDEKQVDLLTVDWEGAPVANVPLTVVFMEHRWYSVRRQAEDGNFYWDWMAEDTPVFTTTVNTDDQGRAETLFTPKQAGTYRVRATGRDQYENEIRSSAYFWVWGGDDYVRWRQESNNRIELIADKEEYQIGDVAEILIPSPYSGTVQALVTTERGHIMETEVRELASNSEVLRVPITEDHVPNVFLSVFLVQGSGPAPDGLATFKMGLVQLPVSIEAKELTISLMPDKDMEAGEHYSPRQTATYDLRVTDSQGQPVEAEFSLRLADLAVLALADEPGPTLTETFWRERGLGIKTSTPLVVAMEAFNRELRPEAKGGGGGDDGGLVRSRFADTAFWDPVVRTDENGEAQIEVQLPDNLTTWRMQARGITADTQVGRAEVDILSTLDLLVRPVLPRFFVAGDQAEIATIVHNNTADDLDAQVRISVSGLSLAGDTSQSVRIAAGDQVKVVWPVTALTGDSAQVRMWAAAGDLYDGREDTLPVYRYSTPEVMATAGQIEEPGTRQEIIQLPRTFDPTQGELAVQIDGSLTAATQDAVDYLEHYPYECVEQTVSRFLPNVVTWQALDQMGIERPELRQNLSQMVGLALQRLYNQQHYDGGWGWWVGDTSDPYLTAYVLHGMLEAHRAGFVVEEEVMFKASEYLQKELPSVDKADISWQANRLAYGLYVLAEHQAVFSSTGPGGSQASSRELGLAIRLFDKRELLSHYGQATLAVALSLLQDEDADRIQTLLGDLAGQAVVGATGAHWEESQPDYWNMNTDTRSTAIVIWALSRLEPDHALLPNAVRWLMAVRQEGYWESTQTTAWSLLGLVEYMKASGELAGDFSYTVYLNGQEWASGDVSEESIDQGLELQVEIGQLLVEEGNRLVIERHPAQAGQTGEGQLYYATHLRYYLPADHVQALDRGILVARQYSPVDEEATYVDTAQAGDVIKVKLTIIAPTDLHYVVVEDPLPAGFEGVDLSLKTTSVVGERPSLRNVTAQEESNWYRWYGWGWWWFSHSEMRDEKVSLFAQYLPRGTYEYTYLMRAGLPGRFLVMPATAYQMYFPEVFGRSDGGVFTVQE